RIETLFSQLCDQMMLRRNYAKSLTGLKTRLISKIAAVTLLQWINYHKQKPINHLKHALAA
ncbi:MAG: IS982 family transposase, partial [Sphingobacteriales bacterium]|nr:IS982 family transposase [Sphingobacteriales bacterium]